MNKLKCTKYLAGVMSAVLLSFGLGMTVSAAEETKAPPLSECVEAVTANTYVGDDGEMTDSFIVTVNDASVIEGIKLEDLSASQEVAEWGSDTITVVPVELENVTVDGTEMTITPAEPVSSNSVVTIASSDVSFTSDIAEKDNRSIVDFEDLSFTGSNGMTIPYRLRNGSGDGQPLVIWMHGSGECGTDNRLPITGNRGATAFAEYTDDAYVIAAQYPEKYNTPFEAGEEETMEAWLAAYNELIQSFIDEGKVDGSRVYLTGASMGGGLVFRFMTDYPDLFARVMSMCSRGTINEDLSVLEALADKPIWLFHAESDPVNPASNSKEVYDKLQELGNTEAKLTIFSDEDLEKFGVSFPHAIWGPVLKDMEMMEWLFS